MRKYCLVEIEDTTEALINKCEQTSVATCIELDGRCVVAFDDSAIPSELNGVTQYTQNQMIILSDQLSADSAEI